jgi:hypothetical protein
VRATDGEGETQTEVRQRPAPDGATGYHGISLSVNDGESLIDPNRLEDPAEALQAARARWEAFGAADYDMRFRWRCLCSAELISPIDLQVRASQLASAAYPDGPPAPASQLAEYMTVPALFDFIQDAIDPSAVAINVT